MTPPPHRAAATVISELGISEPSDIKIDAIAQYLKATVVYEPLHGCAARLAGYGERAIITVDSSAPRARQRFSIGHEIGHWIRDRGKAAFSCTESNLARDWHGPERDANRYAADLLLPEKMFKNDARGRPPTFASARALAELYQTSLTSTAIRLVEHGPLPAMLICSDATKRRWMTRSPIVKLWPHKMPRTATMAARLLRGETAIGAETVDADDWIDHRDAHNYCIVEESILVFGSVLTLLWWKNEAQLVALDDE